MRKVFAILLITIALLSANAFAVKQIMPLHGKASIATGDLRVFIYDAASGGNLIYDSINDFNSAISSQIFDVNLGGKSTILDLNYGTTYWMDLQANLINLSFNPGNTDRKQFESHIGNDINASNIKVSSNALTFKNTAGTTEFMRITSDGNLGIGNTSPRGKFNVIGDVNFLTSAAAIPSMYISFVDGNISIAGTSVTSGYRLDVNGNVRFNADLNVGQKLTVQDLNVVGTTIIIPGYVRDSAFNGLTPAGGIVDANIADDITASRYLANSFLANIFPVADVNILSSVRFNQDASCDNNTNCKDAGYTITDFNAIFRNDVNANKINSNTISSKDNNSLSLQTFGITRLIILSDGSIGIGGDTTPDYNLEVGGTFAVSSTASANADRLIVASDGNVGIATSTPRNKLNVIGDFNVIKTGGIGVPAFYIVAGDGNVGIGTATPRNLFNMTAGDANFAVRTTIANDLNINKGGASGVNISADSNKVCLGSPCNHFIDFNGTTTIIQ